MRKIFLIIFLVFLFFLLVPTQTQAGLVPCGLSQDDPKSPYNETDQCNLCHVFVLTNNIIAFLLLPVDYLNNNLPLIPTIAALMFIIGGFYLLIAGGSPELFSKAKSILTATVIGLIIVFVAWVFLNTFLDTIGVAEWTGLMDNPDTPEVEGWWKIQCP